MAEVSYYDAKRMYNNLVYICEKIASENLWEEEQYISHIPRIDEQIKKLKLFLRGVDMYKEYVMWMEAIPSFEAVYEKLCYIASSKEEKTLRNAHDQCNRIIFNQ